MTQVRSEYDTQAEAFLTSAGIAFKAEATPENNCPRWDDEKHIHGNEFKITLKRKHGRVITFRFWNSYQDAHNGAEPRAYSVLACITKSDPGTFENFCGDFGYDTDSRKGFETYKAVVKEWEKVSRFFTPSELEALQEIN